jgi:hypothetical protein
VVGVTDPYGRILDFLVRNFFAMVYIKFPDPNPNKINVTLLNLSPILLVRTETFPYYSGQSVVKQNVAH